MFNKVTSLELAKRMKELGWDYAAERYWYVHKEIDKPDYKDCVLIGDYRARHVYQEDYWLCFHAPDAIELMEKLPDNIRLYKENKVYYCHYSWVNERERKLDKNFARTEANYTMTESLGKMWCYLKERNLL